MGVLLGMLYAVAQWQGSALRPGCDHSHNHLEVANLFTPHQAAAMTNIAEIFCIGGSTGWIRGKGLRWESLIICFSFCRDERSSLV